MRTSADPLELGSAEVEESTISSRIPLADDEQPVDNAVVEQLDGPHPRRMWCASKPVASREAAHCCEQGGLRTTMIEA